MSEQAWNVDVDGNERKITVDTDAESGRAMIRVDGRLTAKPLGLNEQEREFPVGTYRYVLRRLSEGGFDLEFVAQDVAVPPQRTTRVGSTPAPPQAGSGWTVGRTIWVIVGIVIALFIGRVAWVSMQYMRVPWKTYTPSDSSFTAIFPGDPTEEKQDLNIGGDIWSIHMLHGSYRAHAYLLGYVDAHVIVVEENSDSLLDRFLGGMTSGERMKLLTKQKTTFRRDHAIDFTAEVPKTDEHPIGTVRGRLVLHHKRFYILWAITPQGQSSAYDVEKFLKAFDVTA